MLLSFIKINRFVRLYLRKQYGLILISMAYFSSSDSPLPQNDTLFTFSIQKDSLQGQFQAFYALFNQFLGHFCRKWHSNLVHPRRKVILKNVSLLFAKRKDEKASDRFYLLQFRSHSSNFFVLFNGLHHAQINYKSSCNNFTYS